MKDLFNHLSESNIKRWLSVSWSACANSLFSASIIEIVPHTTYTYDCLLQY